MIDRMYQQSPKDQLHIQEFLSANCFGDYYTRRGLDIKTRELLTFAMLISLAAASRRSRATSRATSAWATTRKSSSM